MASHRYERLHECESSADHALPESSLDESLPTIGLSVDRKRSTRRIWTINCLLMLSNLTLGAILALLYLNSSLRSDLGPYEYRPLEQLIRKQTTYFNLTLGIPTEYTMPGSPEVDALWQNITAPPGKVGRIKVGKEDLDRANITSIALADSSEYFATLDVFHELHCLDLLRKALADDEYTEKPQDGHMWKEHRDSLRLALQCQSDLSLLSFKWVKDYAKPWPDFRGYHTCRNWEDVLSWAHSHPSQLTETHHYIHPQYGLIDGIHASNQNPIKDGKLEWLDPF